MTTETETTSKFNALDVIRSFQDDDDGWDDKTVVVLLAQFIDNMDLAARMANHLARHIIPEDVQMSSS